MMAKERRATTKVPSTSQAVNGPSNQCRCQLHTRPWEKGASEDVIREVAEGAGWWRDEREGRGVRRVEVDRARARASTRTHEPASKAVRRCFWKDVSRTGGVSVIGPSCQSASKVLVRL